MIRTAIAAVLLLVLSETVCCRFVHKIEDYNKPMHEHVAECRKGCLLKVCALGPRQSHSTLNAN